MQERSRFILIGAGIMSATLGILIKHLLPNSLISIYERLDIVGAESSDAWNNAGTGHSAFCELNYTPIDEKGNVDISKALRISESFEISKQLWAYLQKSGKIKSESPFINDIDHLSFVWGKENIKFLNNRYHALKEYGMFDDMLYSNSFSEISEWVPLMMNGRNSKEKVAATRMAIGTDVNFGAITRSMINYLETLDGVNINLGHQVEDLTGIDNGWLVDVTDLSENKEKSIACDFVFIGAGGGAIPLLDKSEIPEGKGYGGFPVSGKFLKCNNPVVIKEHEAKVYGKAAYGSPPMSVPHLDTRMLDGNRSLLFGPYAGFSTKFLKNGSYMDLPLSIEMHNVWPILSAGMNNIGLTKYLIKQVTQSKKDRFTYLQQFYPNAKMIDWELITAGQRVQIIKKEEDGSGALKFGTEIVCNKNKTLAALLGASPGASTSVSIMIDVIKTCFPDEMKSSLWQSKIKEMIPSYGESLILNGTLCKEIREKTTKILKLD